MLVEQHNAVGPFKAFEQKQRLAFLDFFGRRILLVFEGGDDINLEIDIVAEPLDVQINALLEIGGVGLGDNKEFNVHGDAIELGCYRVLLFIHFGLEQATDERVTVTRNAMIGYRDSTIKFVGEGYAGVHAALEIESLSEWGEPLDDVPEEQRRSPVGMALGVESRQEGVGATAIESHKTGGMEKTVVVAESQEDALLAGKRDLNNALDKVERELVTLPPRRPILSMETGKSLGREVFDGREHLCRTAYGALATLFVETIENPLRVGDVLDAVGDAGRSSVVFPPLQGED